MPTVTHLADATPTPAPLTAEEAAEMKEHLAFLRTYKDVLRLRLNAAEDLLVNGRREPSDRGVCRHLLGKVDRSVVEAAIAREPLQSNVEARARMLAGAVRLTADTSVLLGYLETLPQLRARTEAAQAFAEVVRRIDFTTLSAHRLARLLHVLTETFSGHERVQVLFSLLDGEAFRQAFDAAAASLPAEIADVFAPLRAVHRRILESSASAERPDLLARGIEQVLSAPDPLLRAYAEPLRRGILEIALGPGVPPALADRAAGVLLSSLASNSAAFTSLALRRTSQLLARHADDRARAVLEELRRAAPGTHAAQQWLEALDAKHIGRIALRGVAQEGRLAPAWWLDGQRPVWLRTAASEAATRLADEARLQRDTALPGVAAVVEHGVASGIPYVAVAGDGRPWSMADALARPPLARLLDAAAIGRILRGLGLAGVGIPDADPPRFLAPARERFASASLVLADLDGAATNGDAAETLNAHAALALVRSLFPEGLPIVSEATAEALATAIAGTPSLAELIAALERAALASR